MKIAATGILSHAEPATRRATLTFPSIVALADGTLLATLRAGSTKDSDDEVVELYRSPDNGDSWTLQQQLTFDGAINKAHGTLKICYLTELAPDRLMAAAMWIDRTTYPGAPLFNPDTEGCLPMFILLADSDDRGATWSPWRVVPLPESIGPASLTSPILRLPDATLVMSIETNKHYHDVARWDQHVVLFRSHDNGQSWGPPRMAGHDPSGRIFNWDQRLGLAPDGTIGAFVWTYDNHTHAYLNVHRRVSRDQGRSWAAAEDLGFADQAGPPAVFADGRAILPWVDRFGTQTIRARMAAAIDAEFTAASEVTIYSLDELQGHHEATTGGQLAEMALWTFGLPFAVALPDGDALVAYYAGSPAAMDIRWARLRP